MKTALVFSVISLMAAAAPAWSQQAANPVVASARELITRQSGFIIAAAEMMPAEKYGYHPTAEQWSYGRIVAHVVQGNAHVCAMLTDAPPPQAAVAETTSKDELLTALKGSVDYCNTALAGLKDTQLGDTITFFGGAKKPRARALVELVGDLEDHYSQMAGYLRMNGLIPPSVRKR